MTRPRRVVVTGMGVVTPIGVGRRDFFEGLRRARSGIADIRSFDAQGFPTQIAGEVKTAPQLPGWEPLEQRAAIAADPKSRFALAAAQEALTDAFGGDAVLDYYDGRRIAVQLASGLEIFHLRDLVAHLNQTGLDSAGLLDAVHASPARSYLQIPAHLAAQAIARHIGAQGNLTVNVSACAAGTQSLGEAFWAIRHSLADIVVAGGCDSMVNPLGIGGFCMLGALSCANHLQGAASRPFDARRDGFVLGEGSAVFILEAYETALRRGAPFYAEILGYGASMDAHGVADPDPTGEGPLRAMQKAVNQAGLPPARIGYINAHGTGTPKNDPMETRAIRRLIGADAERVPVSSLKSQIGHLIGAAGAVEFAAGLFALTEELLPATINLQHPDPRCDLDYVPNQPRPAKIDTFLSNSFGFGGQNAAIIAGTLDARPGSH